MHVPGRRLPVLHHGRGGAESAPSDLSEDADLSNKLVPAPDGGAAALRRGWVEVSHRLEVVNGTLNACPERLREPLCAGSPHRGADCTTLPLLRREALARLPLDLHGSNGMPTWESVRGLPPRCRIDEGPIIFVERRLGQSKVSWRVLAESLIVPWRLVLGKRRSAARTAGG